MKFPFIKRKQVASPEEEVMLALDIGTTYVKVAVFRVENNEVHIKGYAKSRQQANAMRGAMIVNIKKVISVCDLAIGEALSMSDKTIAAELGQEGYETPSPSKVVLGIAGEFVKGVAIIANHEREDPEQKITKEEVMDVVDSVKDQAFEDVLEDVADEIGIDTNNIVEIKTVVNSTYIDGVKVDDPEGFTGKEVAYRVFTTFTPALHLNSLKEVVNALGLELHSIEVEPYAIARAFKGAREENFSGIIIDIGGGTTDIALIDTGGVVGTKMFAYGGNVFTRRLEVDFEKEYQEAEDMKLDYSNLKLGEAMQKKANNSLAKDMPIWVEGVELALADFDDIKSYPPDIYICGGGSVLPDIKQGLIEYPWLNMLPFRKFPKPVHIYPNQLAGLIDDTRKLVDPSDIAPAALALSVLN